MSRISEAFNRSHKVFIPFVTCGDPDLDTTRAIVKEMAANGADIIELGIPFSDPTAEGPVIQEANIRADDVMNMVAELRNDVDVALVFMTYANVVFSYGIERFVSRCADIGIDGIILPDVPFEEKREFDDICQKYQVDFISMIAPTSEDRIDMIAKEARGFIYVVSSLGVTGERSKLSGNIASLVDRVRTNTNVPCAVGFGISTPEQAAEMARISDGAIVGSAIVRMIAKYGKDAPVEVGKYVKSMKEAY